VEEKNMNSTRLTEISVCSGPYQYSQLGMLVGQTSLSNGTLALNGSQASWVLEAAKKLDSLRLLQGGWDSYGGLPLDQEAKKLTVSVLGWLEGEELPVPAVVLGSCGNVQLEWRLSGRELEVDLRPDNTVEFVKIDKANVIGEGEENSNLPLKLRGLSWWLIHGYGATT
jgi:hypothetical protein